MTIINIMKKNKIKKQQQNNNKTKPKTNEYVDDNVHVFINDSDHNIDNYDVSMDIYCNERGKRLNMLQHNQKAHWKPDLVEFSADETSAILYNYFSIVLQGWGSQTLRQLGLRKTRNGEKPRRRE